MMTHKISLEQFELVESETCASCGYPGDGGEPFCQMPDGAFVCSTTCASRRHDGIISTIIGNSGNGGQYVIFCEPGDKSTIGSGFYETCGLIEAIIECRKRCSTDQDAFRLYRYELLMGQASLRGFDRYVPNYTISQDAGKS